MVINLLTKTSEMKSQLKICMALLFCFYCTAALLYSQNSGTKNSKVDTVLFTGFINKYAKSIDNADPVLASELWAKTPEISFISPRGNEYGWNGVKNIIKIFRDNFSKRKLNCFDMKVSNYGEFAWLEFYWVFDAILNIGNESIQTKGRETQIWRKINNEWRLVHVHYS